MNDTGRAIRRQLTILNCDLVDSTAYADKLDPEAFRTLLQRFFDQSVIIVERHDGKLVQNMGDGFVAIFGYPRTNRMAEVNAINCGLELAEMMATDGELQKHVLIARFGVATGPVILSTLSQGGLFDNIAFGSPANRAARLQALAPRGCVTVDQTTYDQVNRQFHFSSLGTQPLKGFAEPSSVWQVEGRQTLESRFQEFTERLTPMIGRELEIVQLLERWVLAKDGQGQTVLLTGEPGAGKSRLTYELRQRVAEDEPTQIVLQCEEGFENTALHPLARFIERRAELNLHETLADKNAKLRARVRDDLGVDENLATFFVSLTAFSQSGDESVEIAPERKLEALRFAVVERLISLAESRPLLLVLENAQWIDPTSKLLIETLAARAQTSRIFAHIMPV